MSEERDSLFSVLRREPEQTQLILKLGLGAPVAIVLWDWIAGMFLSTLIVLPVTLLLILTYAGVLTYLIARLVHSVDRWRLESAENARRLIGGNRRGERAGSAKESTDAPAAEAPVLAPAPSVSLGFHLAYFFLRLNEAILRARREGAQLSLLALNVTLAGGEPTTQRLDKLSFEVAKLVSGQAQLVTQAVNVGPTEYVFCLANYDGAAARDFASKLIRALGDYWCHHGIAVYPADATNGQALFDQARAKCEESRQGRTPGDAKPKSLARSR